MRVERIDVPMVLHQPAPVEPRYDSLRLSTMQVLV
jgi:hypothetical protein